MRCISVIALFILSLFLPPEALACIPGGDPSLCPEQTLELIPDCLYSSEEAGWSVRNPNPVLIEFAATVDCADPSLPGRIQYLTVLPFGEIEFSTPVVEKGCEFLAPTVSVWSFGRLDDSKVYPAELVDQCGVCGGENLDLGCDGVCFSGKVLDECGICGGDGSSCKEVEEECVFQEISSKEQGKIRKILRSARKLKKRTKQFSVRAAGCGGGVGKLLKKARRVYRSLQEVLESEVESSTLVCTSSVCSEVSTSDTKTRLRALSRRLARIQLKAKLSSIEACRTLQSSEEDLRLTTVDYRNRLLESVSKLSDTRMECS